MPLFIRRVYHPTWSQDQRSNTFHHIKERFPDNCVLTDVDLCQLRTLHFHSSFGANVSVNSSMCDKG